MRFYLIIFLCMLSAAAPLHAAQKDKRIIVGYVEKISIPKVETNYKAKLDTGAATTSIHATIIEMNEQSTEDSEGYVIFTIDSEEGKSNHIKKPIERIARIKKKEGGALRRPVVMMTFCIAGALVEEEVNLSDRDHFTYDVLIGRNMLEKGQLIIDVSKSFTALPNCIAPAVDAQ